VPKKRKVKLVCKVCGQPRNSKKHNPRSPKSHAYDGPISQYKTNVKRMNEIHGRHQDGNMRRDSLAAAPTLKTNYRIQELRGGVSGGGMETNRRSH